MNMVTIKVKLFDINQIRISELMKSFLHPSRIAIIELLVERERCICGDITEELPLAQSTVSQHLKALKTAGIIKGEIDGVRVCYCLNEEGVKDIKDYFTPLVENLTTATEENCC
jgi:ArsR family transcriptional regulator